MRILMVAPQVPWPMHQGTSLRNGNIALELARRHDLTLIAFSDGSAESGAGSPDEASGSAAIGPLAEAGVRVVAVPAPGPRPPWRRALDLPTTWVPDLARRLESPAMRAAAQRVAREGPFDVIQIEGLEMVRHGLAAVAEARAAGQQPRVVYDAHNAEWVLQDRAWRADLRRMAGWVGAFYSRIQTAKLRRFERELLGAVDATVAVSEADAAALRAVEGRPRGAARALRGVRARIEVVPNGVDVDAVKVAEPAAVEAGTCLFIGKMDFRPNVDAMSWLAREAWPLVRAEVPEARLWIVGRDPNAAVLALAKGPNGIEVVGGVPEVSTWLARAAVVVVPLRIGGGTRLKVLEAMSAGKAIAATTMAVEGLHVTHEHEALLGDRPTEFAHCVVRLLRDAALRGRLGVQARHRVERDYPWSALVPRIEALYDPRQPGPTIAPAESEATTSERGRT